MLEPGTTAPDFTLPDQHGSEVSLSALDGGYVVLYFYPQAATRGCTLEARGFREIFDDYRDLGVPVLGVSMDPVEDLADFAAEEDLPFTLLSDEEGTVAKNYQVYKELERDGERIEIADRVTVLIGPDGTVEAVYEDVDPETHAKTVLEDLRTRMTG